MNHHRIPGFAAQHWLPPLVLLAFLALTPGYRAFAQLPPPSAPQQEQNLMLFEPVTGSAQAEIPIEQRGNMQVAPAFTLVGTSRIGSKYTAILASRDGSITRVSAAPGSVADIPNHAGYRVVDIGSRQVSLTTPGNDPCIEAQDGGISCNAIGVTQLSLATAAPIAVPAQAVPGNDPAAIAVNGAEIDPNAPPENPFAAAVRMAREAEASGRPYMRRRAENPEAFQPRRIAPEDVPPGMRVVRTPFGDRMVPGPQ